MVFERVPAWKHRRIFAPTREGKSRNGWSLREASHAIQQPVQKADVPVFLIDHIVDHPATGQVAGERLQTMVENDHAFRPPDGISDHLRLGLMSGGLTV